MIARKKARKQSDVDSEDEHKKCLKIVTFESILDSEIMEKKSVIARLNKVSSPDGDYLVIYRANGNFRAFNYLMEVLHIFDRQDLFHLYDLIRDQFSEVTLDGFELILWGDLKIMMESSTEGNEQSDFWSGQQDWKIVTWRLYESCGVCILEFEDGIVIYMLVEIRHKNWLVHKQTACGKDFSNPFMVDNLPKIVGFSTHLALLVKSWLVQDQTVLALASPKANELTIPEQTATGKGTSNPFMADEIPPPPPHLPSSSQTPTQQTPHTVSTIKLPILKKGEYDIWAMKMEHYLAHTDYPIWEVIQNGNGPVSITTDTQGQIKVLPPRTAEEIVARERERKARTTLLMALPEDHLAKFHKMTDAKEMWDAIKSRFGGNDESKKMQKYILKQQFEGFSVSNSEGLHKGYDRFQSLLSQLEIHGAGVSTEDANQKFLRSLPSAWSQVSLIMRTKPGVKT
ncbi:hypothetical protein Tco_1026049 [Tanacetum coccineum]